MKNVAARKPHGRPPRHRSCCQSAVEGLQELSKPVGSKQAIARSPRFRGYETVGQLISDAMEKVGNAALSPLKRARPWHELTIVEGMQFDRGYASATWLRTPRRWKHSGYALHLITDKKIGNIRRSCRCFQQLRTEPFVLIIAEDVEGEALTTLVLNKLRGTFNCIASGAWLRRSP